MNTYPIDLACRILDLLDGELVTSQLEDIAKVYVGNSRSKQTLFLNKLYSMLDNIPTALWDSPQQRNQSLALILKQIDSATIRQIGAIKFRQLSTPSIRRFKNFV